MSNFSILSINPTDPDAASRFSKSLRETGFAIIKDHGITLDEINSMYAAWASFFQKEDKFHFVPSLGQSDGYFGYRSENAKDVKQKDLKEFFHVYSHKPIPAELESPTRDFNRKMVEIGILLLDWLDLETPKSVNFSEPLTQMIKESPNHLLRILHYPPLLEEPELGATRAAAHGDINLITLLVTGSEPGLQAQDVDENWHDIPCQAGYITVNSGDMLSKASKGYYPSTVHRVINPPVKKNHSRYSMPLFIHPREDVILDRLDRQTAGEFLDERLKEIGLK